MDVEEITEQLEKIKTRLSGIEEDVNIINSKKNQENKLSQNLSPFDSKLIKSQIILPVAVNIIGTSAATAANYGTFFTADRPYILTSVTEVHGTLGTDASAVTLQVQSLTGTTALGSGNNLLSTAIDLKGTINTVQYPPLVSSDKIILNRGDRLALKTTGTLTAVADVQVTVFLSLI